MKLMEIYRELSEGLISSVDPVYFESAIVEENIGGVAVSAITIQGQSGGTEWVEVELEGLDDGYIETWDAFITAYERINKKANLMGWYPALYLIYGTDENGYRHPDVNQMSGWLRIKKLSEVGDFKFEDLYVKIQYEAKYDIVKKLKNSLPDKIYHITDKKHVEKIKRIGLSPKAGEKHSNHPGRIYFALDKQTASRVLLMGLDDYLDQPVWLEINTGKLQDGFVCYADPQFKGGWYTYNNIPPSAIEVVWGDV